MKPCKSGKFYCRVPITASKKILFDLNKYFNAFKNLFAVQLFNNADLGPIV